MKRLTWTAAAITLLAIAPGGPLPAQDIQPAPADVDAVKALLKTATTALLEKDARGFIDCCDPYVYCFFVDGTLVRGKTTIARTLREFFANRPDDLVIKLDDRPRSYRVLSPDIIMVDWPATIRQGDRTLTVNTLTTVRKTDGKWYLTAYLESVPFARPVGGRPPERGQRRDR